jgi:NMT1/THI5 like
MGQHVKPHDTPTDARSEITSDEGAQAGLTRRSFIAKAGLAAAGIGLAGALPAVAASCGSSSGGGASPGTGGEAAVVRFVFAPDPIWNYMNDTGIVARYEEKYNMKIVNTETWDETAWFIGGHADIASTASYETPTMMLNSGKEFVAFGQYNMMRNTIFVKTDSPYQTIEDLKGKRIAVSGGGADAIMWRAMILEKYGLDMKLGGGDFKCNVQEFDAMPTALDRGQIDACVGLIDYEIPYMVNGTHRWLWPDLPTGWEFYREHFDPQKEHIGVMMNLFVGQKEWVDKNPKLCEGFNMMWQVGVNEYWADKEASILAYPDLYTVQNDKELQWFLDYLENHDSCVKTVYMDQTWTEKETQVVDLCKQTGTIPPEAPDMAWKIMAPPPDAPTEALPPSTAASPV